MCLAYQTTTCILDSKQLRKFTLVYHNHIIRKWHLRIWCRMFRKPMTHLRRDNSEELPLSCSLLWKCLMRSTICHPDQLIGFECFPLMSQNATQMLAASMNIYNTRNAMIHKSIKHSACRANTRCHIDPSVILVFGKEHPTPPIMFLAGGESWCFFNDCTWSFDMEALSPLGVIWIDKALVYREIAHFAFFRVVDGTQINQALIIPQLGWQRRHIPINKWHHVHIDITRRWESNITTCGKSNAILTVKCFYVGRFEMINISDLDKISDLDNLVNDVTNLSRRDGEFDMFRKLAREK
mmetsp:Transcript_17122/g.25655  ORF Transcript_17122/g.25655 Transcript_17122/m.25655 type:complete len:296 (-) Transcript_17122:276-1163(-)